MEAPRRRLYLDRFESFLLLAVFVLASGMMFTLGVLVGHGIGTKEKSAELAEGTHAALGEGSAHGEHGAPAAHGEAEHGRAPASAKEKEETAKEESGARLRKAFRESKQEFLVELSLRETSANKPTSVRDAEAHLAAHDQWNRRPASDELDPVAEEVKKQKKEEDTRTKAGVPTSVKHLFERHPGSTDAFSPTAGSYTVQIGSYATHDEASAQVGRLQEKGFNDAYTAAAKTAGGDTWYRVGVGSFSSAVWARRTGEKIVRRKLARSFVVRKVHD
jgi:cell division septation protein DedD